MTKIAVLVSGSGTNLQALIDAKSNGLIPSGDISLVLSSAPDAYALTRAKEHNTFDCSYRAKSIATRSIYRSNPQ